MLPIIFCRLESGDKAESEKSDIIYITGNKHKCEAAKKALLESVPISEDVNVPFKFHRYLIGQKGEEVRRFMKMYEVNVSIPQADQQSDVITVSVFILGCSHRLMYFCNWPARTSYGASYKTATVQYLWCSVHGVVFIYINAGMNFPDYWCGGEGRRSKRRTS